MSYLQSLVLERARELGVEEASKFFEVTPSLVKQWIAESKTPSLAAVEKVFRPPSTDFANAGWEGKEVFIGLPQYKFTNPATLFSLLGIWDRAKFGAIMRYGDAFIAHTRNRIAHEFLQTGKEWLWWVDDDVVFPLGNAAWYNTHTGLNLPEKFAAVHTPTRLRQHGKSIVSGLYFGRSANGRAVYAEALIATQSGNQENEYAKKAPVDELRPASWCGTGCLMTHRKVYEDIQAKYPHLAPQHPSEPFHFFSNASDGIMRAFGDMKERVVSATDAVKNGRGAEAEQTLVDLHKLMLDAEASTIRESRLQQGEDHTFGLRARTAGHQSFVDLAVRCGHVGTKVY